jgi:hypothetical protein
MLDLDARVHLDEVKAPLLVHEEFDGAGIVVADMAERFAEDAPISLRSSGVIFTDGDSSISFWWRR